MLNRNKKTASGEKHRQKKQTTSRLNLKPNEAYEPGFGKYTLTESELQFGKISQEEVNKFSAAKLEASPTKPGTAGSTSAQGTAGDTVQSHHNSPGINQHPGGAEGNEDLERKKREENTNMHNNW